MAETFTWRTERDLDPTIDFRVITAQFGDGYKQTSADGINNKNEQYAIKVHAYETEAKLIKEFFDRHQGWKSFFWTPPLGTIGLYTCADPKPVAQGGGLYLFTGTFVKSYASLAS